MSLSRQSFSERYRLLFNRRGSDWWSIVFGYPVARAFVVAIEHWRWLKASHLTLVGFCAKLISAFLLVSSDMSPWYAALALQISQVFDSMDGTVARARKEYSKTGAFLDKSTDAIGLFVIACAVGIRAFEQTQNPMFLLAACVGGAAFLVLCYMFWQVKVLSTAEAQAPIHGGAEPLSWSALFREWGRGWFKIFQFNEADLYLWIAVFAIVNRWDFCALFLAATQGISMVKRFIEHLYRLSREGA